MKRLAILFALGLSLVLVPKSFVQAAVLGDYHLAFKVDYLKFTDDIDSRDIEKGPYIGIELFGRVFDNFYLGGEVGYFNQEDGPDIDFTNSGDVELTYVPVELNLKYAVGGYRWVWAVGGGPSYNYVDFDGNHSSFRETEEGWFWGGQVFMDLNYAADLFFAGINGKYQFVEGDFDNWRLGGQAGFHF